MEPLQDLLERIDQMQLEVDSLQDDLDQLRAELQARIGPMTATLPLASAPSTRDTHIDCTLAAAATADRRAAPRRLVNPVPVLLARPEAPTTPFQGWVVDRSPDGLCVVAEEDVLVGTTVRVRPSHNLAQATWFHIEIRNSRPERNMWILGCQFTRQLSRDDLRLFS
jgi:hypothetical protein